MRHQPGAYFVIRIWVNNSKCIHGVPFASNIDFVVESLEKLHIIHKGCHTWSYHSK